MQWVSYVAKKVSKNNSCNCKKHLSHLCVNFYFFIDTIGMMCSKKR
jgi:hypothetical protein